MTHGFWHGRASSSSCLPCWPALRIFFRPPKKVCEWVLWAFDATAFGTEPIYNLYALQLQCWKEPQQVDVPKEQSKHLEATVPQTGQYGISPAHPFHCKITEGLLSWNHCCLPEVGLLGAEGPLLFSDGLFWNPKYNLMIFGFLLLLTGSCFGCFPLQEAAI